MRGKHIVFQRINNEIWDNLFEDGKVLRRLASGNLLVATSQGITELEPKQVILTHGTADWFNREANRWFSDGGSFGIDYLPDAEGNIMGKVYNTLDPDYGAFASCG